MYTGVNPDCGRIYDRSGMLLLNTDDGRVYNADETIRRSTMHLLGDREGFTASQERLEQIEQTLGIPQSDRQIVRTELEREAL